MDQRLNSTWWTLRIALGVAPFLAGLDKFLNLLTNWTQYLNPLALRVIPLSAGTFMRAVGVVEMMVGIAILTRWTRIGAYVASAWLFSIAVNLISTGGFLDIAVRDVVMSIAAFVLGNLTGAREFFQNGRRSEPKHAVEPPRRVQAA